MKQPDIAPFAESLTDMMTVLSHGKSSPDAAMVRVWFRTMQAYTLQQVLAGFDAHMRRPSTGRTLPIPSDIVAQIIGVAESDGRPDGEEAWAIVAPAAKESITVVWSAEMAAAWGQVLALVVQGDMIAARRSFLSVYTRLVAEARAEGLALRWTACLGHDEAGRADAIRTAAQMGRIAGGPAADVLGLDALPAAAQAVALLAGPDTRAGGRVPSGAKVTALSALQALRLSISARDLHAGEIDDTERRVSNAQKGLAADAVAEYEARLSGCLR